jgi:hypothetical protein
MGSVWVTTSWDDGHAFDVRLADLLERYGLPGTFYVAPRCVHLSPRQRLTPGALAALAERFEIGGHTLTHQPLPSLALSAAAAEIRDGKDDLEAMIGAPLRSFCYPGGMYSASHIDLVREAGFSVARTVRRYVSAPPADPLQVATTFHAYRHFTDISSIARWFHFHPGRSWRRWWNWDDFAIQLFDLILCTGGVFHLWGHSWEIDARGEWARVERVLRHIGRRRDVHYIDNGDLLQSTTTRPSTVARAQA